MNDHSELESTICTNRECNDMRKSNDNATAVKARVEMEEENVWLFSYSLTKAKTNASNTTLNTV